MIHGSIPVLCISSGSRPFPFFSFLLSMYLTLSLLLFFLLLFPLSLSDFLFLLLLQFLHHFFPHPAFCIFLFSFTAMHLFYGTSYLVSNNKCCWRRKKQEKDVAVITFFVPSPLSLSSFFCFLNTSVSKRFRTWNHHSFYYSSLLLPTFQFTFLWKTKERDRER